MAAQMLREQAVKRLRDSFYVDNMNLEDGSANAGSADQGFRNQDQANSVFDAVFKSGERILDRVAEWWDEFGPPPQIGLAVPQVGHSLLHQDDSCVSDADEIAEDLLTEARDDFARSMNALVFQRCQKESAEQSGSAATAAKAEEAAETGFHHLWTPTTSPAMMTKNSQPKSWVEYDPHTCAEKMKFSETDGFRSLHDMQALLAASDVNGSHGFGLDGLREITGVLRDCIENLSFHGSYAVQIHEKP